MFEREMRDTAFINRWAIVRKLRPQSVAEHSFMVAMYVNDICDFLKIDSQLHLSALQYALWHDVDEVFSSDIPGPAKRALVKDRDHMKSTLDKWMDRVFKRFHIRSGSARSSLDMNAIKAIIKTADWLEAACEMAGEVQMGNRNAEVHVIHNLKQCQQASLLMCTLLDREESSVDLWNKITAAVARCEKYLSQSPLVDPEERAIAESLGLIPRSS